MELEDFEQQLTCAACGETFWYESCPTFNIQTDCGICANCAVTRGGAYDAVYDAWKLNPQINDLIANKTTW